MASFWKKLKGNWWRAYGSPPCGNLLVRWVMSIYRVLSTVNWNLLLPVTASNAATPNLITPVEDGSCPPGNLSRKMFSRNKQIRASSYWECPTGWEKNQGKGLLALSRGSLAMTLNDLLLIKNQASAIVKEPGWPTPSMGIILCLYFPIGEYKRSKYQWRINYWLLYESGKGARITSSNGGKLNIYMLI